MVTSFDALVINTSEYQRVLSKALSYTSDKNAFVTVGIKPSRLETGYGYIAAASAMTCLYEWRNCVVHAAGKSKVVVQGLDGYIVAEKNGKLLFCSLKDE